LRARPRPAALRAAYPTARLVGIEWSWPLRLVCALRCPWAQVRQGDIWRADWRPYDLVYLFQRPESMPRALAKAAAQMRPGSWLVSLEFERCFEMGGSDYIIQPFVPVTVRARVRTQLALKASATAEAVTIFALTSLAETRDSDTGNHILRTQNYVKCLAQRLQANPKFASLLTHQYIATLFRSVPLYDMGSIGIPDRILLKPGGLTTAEFDIMKNPHHAGTGRYRQRGENTGLGCCVSLRCQGDGVFPSGKVGRQRLPARPGR
jgi:hypothetical protein